MIHLTKYMVEDYLRENQVSVKICGKEPWKFFDLERYTEDAKDHTILYFYDKKEKNSISKGICIAFVLDAESFETYDSEYEEIVCCGSADVCYRLLVSCFSFYKNWYLRLQENLIKNKSLQVLIDYSIPIFKNPIAVSDIGFQVLAYTKEYHKQMEDDESKFIVKHGCNSPEYINLITQHSNFINNLKNNLGPFRFHYDFLQHESIYCTIWLHGKPAGFLTIVGKNELRQKSIIDAAYIFSEILTEAFKLNSARGYPSSPEDQLLLRYLKDQSADPRIARNVLANIPGAGKDTYACVHISMLILNPNQSMLLRKVYDSLFKKLRRSKVLYDNTGITVILSQRDISPEQLAHMVGLLLLSYSYQIGISYPFHDLHEICKYFRQAIVCIDLNKNKLEDHVFYYENCMIQDLLCNQLLPSQKMAAIHPALNALKDYDTKNTTDHLHTLKTYLNANCNGTIAAQKLHIHKNTLYYRLKHIEELTDLTFLTSSVCDCLRLSFYLSETEWV